MDRASPLIVNPLTQSVLLFHVVEKTRTRTVRDKRVKNLAAMWLPLRTRFKSRIDYPALLEKMGVMQTTSVEFRCT